MLWTSTEVFAGMMFDSNLSRAFVHLIHCRIDESREIVIKDFEVITWKDLFSSISIDINVFCDNVAYQRLKVTIFKYYEDWDRDLFDSLVVKGKCPHT